MLSKLNRGSDPLTVILAARRAILRGVCALGSLDMIVFLPILGNRQAALYKKRHAQLLVYLLPEVTFKTDLF
jgi:hypothetical protein